VKGRKRHIAVDTEGLLLRVVVHSAGLQDRDGAKPLLAELAAPGAFPRLRKLWVDGAYAHTVAFAARYAALELEVTARPAGARGFAPLPRRWVVERTFGWFGRYRGLSKDYEATPESEEAWCYLAMTHLMLRRLHPN
jgi:putative transposase